MNTVDPLAYGEGLGSSIWILAGFAVIVAVSWLVSRVSSAWMKRNKTDGQDRHV